MMLVWWAVFFVSRYWCSSRSLDQALAAFLILLSIGYMRTSCDRRRLVLFALCASTSLVIWTTALQPAWEGEAGPLTGRAPRAFGSARERIIDSLEDPSLGERSRSLLSALLLGSRERLDHELREAYAYLGVAHFLALSGLHLGIVSMPLAWAIARLPIGRNPRMACLLLMLTGYALLSGLTPSLVRATTLAAAFMLQRSMGRKTTLVRSLAIVLLFLAMIDGRIVMNGGFQLSCAAVMAIALLGLPMIRLIRSCMHGRRARRIVTIVASPVVITVAVNIITLPMQLLFFGRAPLLAPAYNLLMILPVTFLLYLGLAYAAVPVGALRALLAPPLDLAADLLWEVPLRLSRCTQPAILAGSVCWPLYMAGAGFLAAALRRGCMRRVPCVVAAAALLVSSFAAGGGQRSRDGSPCGEPGGSPLDPAGSALLIACELLVIETDISGWEAERVVTGLWKLGIGRVETLLICPARLGRRSGVGHIVSRIDVTRAYCSPYLTGHDAGLIELLREKGTGIAFVSKADSIEAGRRMVRLRAPSYPPREGKGVPMERACIRYEIAPSEGGREFEN